MDNKAKNNKLLFGIIEICGIMCIGIIVLVMLFFSKKNINEVEIEDVSLYTYLGEEKVNISGSIRYDYDNESAVIESDSNEKIIISSVPLYYSEEQKLILPKNMSYVNFFSAKQVRVPNYTKVYYSNSDYYFSLNEKTEKIYNSFLYDGDDLYLFFNDVILEYDNTSIKLSPLSYVSYNYNKDLYVYDYTSGEVKYFSNVSSANVLFEGVNLNLKSDSIDSEESSKILMKNINNLKKIQMEW